MSRKRTGLLPLCMLALAALGAFLPWGACALQDHFVETQTEMRPLDGIQLSLRAGGVEQTLALLAANYTKIELRDGGKLTEREARQAAAQAVKLLIREKLLPDFTLTEPEEATAFAVISVEDGDKSAVVWTCTFAEAAQTTCIVQIDDATGKLVSVGYLMDVRTSVYVELPESSLQEAESDESRAKRWAAFLQDYYGLESAAVEPYAEDPSSVFALTFTWTKEEIKTSCRLPLMFRGGSLLFNW